MNFTQSFKLAIKSLMLSKMRALLTMLGIIIGVAAVIIITSLGNGMQNYMNAQFEQLGSNLIQVMVYGRGEGGTRDVDTDDMYALVEKYPQYLSGVTPYVSATAKVRQGTVDFDRTSVYGVSEAFYRTDTQKTMQGSSLEEGRFLRYIDVERHQNVCVIGSYLAENAFQTDPLGQTISVSGVPYTVVGVLATDEDRDVMAQLMGGGDNGKLIMPYTSAMRLTNMHSVTNVEVYIQDTDYTDQTVDDLETVLNAAFNYKDDSYSVINMESLLDTMNMMMDVMTGLLAGIASISLLVGGIGIMNMMLVSVTERTTEIGLRKALGAQPRQIQLQFLIESFVLSVLGGLIGLILGLAVSYYFSGYMDIPFRISSFAISLGLGFSAAVGVIFGWAPARKASRLDPIDALRSM